MNLSSTGGMYGREGAFFSNLPYGFENNVWIELIGFDNTKNDFGVKDLVDTMGFKPNALFLLVTSIDIINTHKGLTFEYELDPYFCSYVGHPYNDERKRQRWTNIQLKGLVDTLNNEGIKSYISIFDYTSPKKEFDHPELFTSLWSDGNEEILPCIYMTKRLADGSFYEDFFANKSVEFLTDFGFYGIHLADGICRPRFPLQWADMSDDMLKQAGICIPDGVSRDRYIAENHRREWIDFCAKRWGSFLEKVITKINKSGFKVAINSCWTKDPMEAFYRYGIDYKAVSALPIELVVAENGAPTLSIIDNEANAGYKQSYEERKLLHHSFRASLMLTAVCMEKTKLVPLFPVRDTAEQYDVIHHLPTSLSKHAAAIFSSFIWDKEGLRPVISGNTFCLGMD